MREFYTRLGVNGNPPEDFLAKAQQLPWSEDQKAPISLLPEPAGTATPSERDCRRAWEAYAQAFTAFAAIDHPHSRWAQLPEAEKASMRAERRAKVDALAFQYLQALERAQRLAKRRQAKAAAATRPAATGPRPQRRLFEEAWPEEFDYLAQRFPLRPRVTNDLELGTTIRSRDQAVAWRYVQHNQPTKDHVMVLDYDAPEGTPVHEMWKRAGLPPPTWIAATPGTPKGHIAYALAAPVCTSDAARMGPLRYLAALEQAYCLALNGDRGYAGLLTKNPVHQSAWDVSWVEPRPYTLGDLAKHVQLAAGPGKGPAVEPVGVGRKVHTFDSVRQWAYGAIRDFWAAGFEAWARAVRHQVEEVGGQFDPPLEASHCGSIAKSIAKWTWQRMTPSSFATFVQATHKPEVQALRGRQKGAKKREALMAEALAMLEAGQPQASVAEACGITDRTLRNWIARSVAVEAEVPRSQNRKKPISDNSGSAGPLGGSRGPSGGLH